MNESFFVTHLDNASSAWQITYCGELICGGFASDQTAWAWLEAFKAGARWCALRSVEKKDTDAI
jgi:hypothetical protein